MKKCNSRKVENKYIVINGSRRFNICYIEKMNAVCVYLAACVCVLFMLVMHNVFEELV